VIAAVVAARVVVATAVVTTLIKLSAQFLPMPDFNDIRSLGFKHRKLSGCSARFRPWCGDDEEGGSSR